MSGQEKILILDFGSQYTELIARKIRELNVYSEVHSFDYPIEKIKNENIKGIILSGGPNSIYAAEAPECNPEIFELGIPILGICYGMQLIAHKLGGQVSKGDKHEYGHASLEIISDQCLFADCAQKLSEQGLRNDENLSLVNLNDNSRSEHNAAMEASGHSLKAWMSHGDKVEKIPEGFEVIAKTTNTAYAAIANHSKEIYGVQFHPEVTHTEAGRKVISNFVLNSCKASANWNMHDFIEASSKEIQDTVGEKHVLLALSGGVDSSTLAFLLHHAIGDQLTCMFIDHGFMRKNEPEELMEIFANKFHVNVKYINAKDRFWQKLQGISEPEQKRKVIGNEFINVFEEEVEKIKNESVKDNQPIEFLAQGTLYPDIIESAGFRIDPNTGKKIAHTIKTHHNVGGLPEKMNFKLLEPLKNLFKDEVRRLARELKVPPEIANRHPFPGPGLAIRILGEITKDKLEMVSHSDLIVREEIVSANEYNNIWQLLTAVLPVKSVGVMGDQRTYAHPVVIRAVTSEDAMTADWARVPYELLAKISNRIVNEVAGVNRVVYDITTKPPGTIEWE